MITAPLTFDLGTSGLDLNYDAAANVPKTNSFPVGPAELAVMMFVGGLALAVLFASNSAQTQRRR